MTEQKVTTPAFINRAEIVPGMLVAQHFGAFAVRSAKCLLPGMHPTGNKLPVFVATGEFISTPEMPDAYSIGWTIQGNEWAGKVAHIGSIFPRI